MTKSANLVLSPVSLAVLLLPALCLPTGCATPQSAGVGGRLVCEAVERFAATHGEQLAADAAGRDRVEACRQAAARLSPPFASSLSPQITSASNGSSPVFLGSYNWTGQEAPQTQPAAARSERPPGYVPEGYWRKDIWHQMGYEAKSLATRDLWRGFKTSFWDLENALMLTATMGASVAIREGGVDDAIRRRVKGHRQLGDFDEPIQLLGHPGVHFAGTGVLWLGSALFKNEREHEVAKSLTQALAVNGVTTLALKAATNTRSPDDERHSWPSGHTSSAFTVAAVLNEHYGPWVGVPSLALAGLVGYQRLDSRVHDFSDVVFGAMLGYIVGTSVARDEKARFPELWGMQVVPFADPETGASGIALMGSIK